VKKGVTFSKKKKEEAEATVDAGESMGQDSVLFVFQVLLKPTLPHGRAGPGGSHPIMIQVGRGMGTSQPGEGGPSPGNLHKPQTFLLLAYLKDAADWLERRKLPLSSLVTTLLMSSVICRRTQGGLGDNLVIVPWLLE
jgi:hypothetical protein